MSISAWSEASLAALIEAKDEAAFGGAFESLFSQNAVFFDNGVSQTREEYMMGLIGTGSKYDSQTVKFIKSIEGNDGCLGALYEITGLKDGAATMTIEVTVNARIVEEDGSKKVVFLSQITTPH
ncbi:hypothetical protein BU17DRAFT_98345 [Hysterangium stoloniferum]|nr:hypothetical protein BU17DRAFT_98345 [Hysterangium stoloniferum]